MNSDSVGPVGYGKQQQGSDMQQQQQQQQNQQPNFQPPYQLQNYQQPYPPPNYQQPYQPQIIQQPYQPQAYPSLCQPQPQAYYNPTGPTVVTVLTPAAAPLRPIPYRHVSAQAKGVGVASISNAILAFICQGIAMAQIDDPSGWGYYVGPSVPGNAGFWCGGVFMVAGICLCIASQNTDRVKMLLAAVAGFLSLVFALTLLGITIDVLVNVGDYTYWSFSLFPYFYYAVAILALLGFIQFVSSIPILIACYKDHNEMSKVSAQPT